MFREVCEQTCKQLYLSRLKDEAAFKNTLDAGSIRREFFGFAQGKEDEGYIGFSFGTAPVLFLDA